MNRLTEWRGDHAAIVNHHKNYIDKLAAYEDAEEQGLLVRLPCKVGQEVFTVEDADIYCTVDGVEEIDHILEFGICDCGLTFSTEWYEARPIGEIGKTVFLTREEAEAALKGETVDNGV